MGVNDNGEFGIFKQIRSSAEQQHRRSTRSAKNGLRYLWLLRGKVVRQDEGEIGCTLHFQGVFANGREEPMKFSFVRSLWNHLRFHVQASTNKKYKPPSRCY